MAGELESFRIDDINIRGGNSKDDTVGLGDVFGDEGASLFLDIGGLISDWNLDKVARNSQSRLSNIDGPNRATAHIRSKSRLSHGCVRQTYLCKTWQIHQSQVQHVRRVDLEIDGLAVDALVASGDAGSLVLDFALDIAKVREAATGNMVKLCPLIRTSRGCVAIGSVGVLYRLVRLDIDELQDQRPSCDNTASTWQEIATDNVLEDGRLSGRLGTDDDLKKR